MEGFGLTVGFSDPFSSLSKRIFLGFAWISRPFHGCETSRDCLRLCSSSAMRAVASVSRPWP